MVHYIKGKQETVSEYLQTNLQVYIKRNERKTESDAAKGNS
jgi:hypothetical protein